MKMGSNRIVSLLIVTLFLIVIPVSCQKNAEVWSDSLTGDPGNITKVNLDNETKDLAKSIEAPLYKMDYGDAPDTYHTLFASNGARHLPGDGQMRLGQLIDVEADGLPSQGANGDDLTKLDDEDGVIFASPLIPGSSATVKVTATGPAYGGLLNAWIDFNDNENWADANEKIFNDQHLDPGINTLTFLVPSGAVPGKTYARFRINTEGRLSFDGPVGIEVDGEVEDYVIEIEPIKCMNFDSVEVGSDSARAMTSEMGSKLHTLATNSLEIMKNQDSGKFGHMKYNGEIIEIGNRDSMAVGFASSTNNAKVVVNQQ